MTNDVLEYSKSQIDPALRQVNLLNIKAIGRAENKRRGEGVFEVATNLFQVKLCVCLLRLHRSSCNPCAFLVMNVRFPVLTCSYIFVGLPMYSIGRWLWYTHKTIMLCTLPPVLPGELTPTHTLQSDGKPRVYLLQAASDEEADTWIADIKVIFVHAVVCQYVQALCVRVDTHA